MVGERVAECCTSCETQLHTSSYSLVTEKNQNWAGKWAWSVMLWKIYNLSGYTGRVRRTQKETEEHRMWR